MERAELEEVRRSRRQPRRTQFDYLHLKRLARDLAEVLGRVGTPGGDVLDLYCGSRPYEDMLPPGSRCVGLDITDRYGVADIVTDEFLPFPDASFDLVLCTEAFYYVADPVEGAAELWRLLRPGGAIVLTLPFVWEYDREILEHRYTGPELQALFGGWSGVEVIENGGRAVSWALLTGVLVRAAHRRLRAGPLPGALVDRAFDLAYMGVNALGLAFERIERGYDWGSNTLPMNLTLVARKPAG